MELKKKNTLRGKVRDTQYEQPEELWKGELFNVNEESGYKKRMSVPEEVSSQ